MAQISLNSERLLGIGGQPLVWHTWGRGVFSRPREQGTSSDPDTSRLGSLALNTGLMFCNRGDADASRAPCSVSARFMGRGWCCREKLGSPCPWGGPLKEPSRIRLGIWARPSRVHRGTACIDGGLGGPRGVGADPQGGAGHSGGQKGPWVQNWGMAESEVGSCHSSR